MLVAGLAGPLILLCIAEGPDPHYHLRQKNPFHLCSAAGPLDNKLVAHHIDVVWVGMLSSKKGNPKAELMGHAFTLLPRLSSSCDVAVTDVLTAFPPCAGVVIGEEHRL